MAILQVYRSFISSGPDVIAWTHIMNAIAWITVGTTIAIVSPLLLYRRAKNQPRRDLPSGSSKRPQTSRHATYATNRYHAVSIRPSLYACPAAWKMQEQSFLSEEAPTLPLADCDQETCSCRYRHYSDRRDGQDRRNILGRTGGLLPHAGQNNCRTGRDRRIKLLKH